MNKIDLDEILKNHKKWVNKEIGGVMANLRSADLCGADLRSANLRSADLCSANLCSADLSGANLRSANLRSANLRSADLSGANLSDVHYDANTAMFALNCPEEGSFIGWKKACGDYIVKLRITEDALRSSATTRKCRCSKAEVLEIQMLDGQKANVNVCYSKYDGAFAYKVGEIVEVKDFNEDRWNECSKGIHFFITRDEAVRY